MLLNVADTEIEARIGSFLYCKRNNNTSTHHTGREVYLEWDELSDIDRSLICDLLRDLERQSKRLESIILNCQSSN